MPNDFDWADAGTEMLCAGQKLADLIAPPLDPEDETGSAITEWENAARRWEEGTE